jgi:MSHA biogenesis protein MshI
LLTFSAKGELCMVRRVEVSLQQLLDADDSRRDQLLDRIGLELQRSLDNFDRQFSFVPVNRLLLTPGPFSEKLKVFLGDYLGMPVDVMDLSSVLDISGVPGLDDPDRQAQCLATIGAALRQGEPA